MRNDVTEPKSLVVKRIVIFIILAFVPSFLLQFWCGTDGTMSKNIPGITVMHTPLIANLLTRLITKEGMKDSYMRVNFKSSKRYYVISGLIPIVLGLVSGVVCAIIWVKDYSFTGIIKNDFDGPLGAAAVTLSAFWGAGATLFQGFGEEAGWRAYLTPKLEKLMPGTLAIIVNGIIWGLWHAPLVYYGYNFGTSHSGWANVTLMCVSCVILSFPMTWLTKRANSVWTAALCHTLIDAVMSQFAMLVAGYQVLESDDFMCAVVLMIAVPSVLALATGIGLAVKKAPAPQLQEADPA